MNYSLAFKEKVLRRILPPHNESVKAVAREIGISDVTIYHWRKLMKNGNLRKDGDVASNNRSDNEKLQLIIEGNKVLPDKKGEWLRSNGLHSEHLRQFEQEIYSIVANKSNKQNDELKNLKQENKDLKKELHRKEKALAEMAALLTLKKKADALWGDNEDD